MQREAGRGSDPDVVSSVGSAGDRRRRPARVRAGAGRFVRPLYGGLFAVAGGGLDALRGSLGERAAQGKIVEGGYGRLRDSRLLGQYGLRSYLLQYVEVHVDYGGIVLKESSSRMCMDGGD